MSEVAERVKAIIVDKLSVEETEVTNEASFTNDLGADSLDTVELIMEFEKEFGISIPDDQAEKLEPLILTKNNSNNSSYENKYHKEFGKLVTALTKLEA